MFENQKRQPWVVQKGCFAKKTKLGRVSEMYNGKYFYRISGFFFSYKSVLVRNNEKPMPVWCKFSTPTPAPINKMTHGHFYIPQFIQEKTEETRIRKTSLLTVSFLSILSPENVYNEQWAIIHYSPKILQADLLTLHFQNIVDLHVYMCVMMYLYLSKNNNTVSKQQ